MDEDIENLRTLFNIYGIDAYLISCQDEYLNEYIQEYAKRLKFITGFSGSNGMAIIGKNFAYFFTDGRYIEQSHKELDLNIFEIININNFKGCLQKIYNEYQIKIGYDPKIFSYQFIHSLKLFHLIPIKENLIDLIWEQQPKKLSTKAYIYSEEYAGQNYIDKIKFCQNALKEHQAHYLIINKPDSFNWLLNIRASDIMYCPILLGTFILGLDNLYLFTNLERLDENFRAERPEIILFEESELDNFLSNIDEKILIDKNYANDYLINVIKNSFFITDPTLYPKACKNEIEISCAINSHIYDAVALIEFFNNISSLDLSLLSEYDLGILLTDFRKKQPLYIMDSFNTICGFKENGSIIHYQANKNLAKKIIGSGLLLIDSGGQYLGCTTDITRTIAIGNPSLEEKKYYTKVLKGYIALANITFPEGISGAHLDTLARQYLWEEGKDYAHGTGHGVGSFLNVHEGPQNINRFNTVPLVPGMILSNEPGYYEAGHFGIRTESLMNVVQAPYKGYLQFNILSLVPFDKQLIDFGQLNDRELEYIRSYYIKISNNIMNLLSQDAKKWLINQLNIE